MFLMCAIVAMSFDVPNLLSIFMFVWLEVDGRGI